MNTRGQTLVLLALTLLLLTLMVMMTLSIGTAAARKADLSNAADAAAYSTAVATARSFNTGAILNRTIVSHYVAMAGVEAQMAYATTVHNYFNLAGVMFRLYDDADSSGDGRVDYTDSHTEPYKTTGCSQRTTEVRDASYEMWHVALRGLRPPGGSNPPDNLNSHCQNGPCTQYRPWLAENEALLEQAAAEQGRAIHGAIWDLARIQRRTYRNLEDAVQDGTWAREIASAAKVGPRGLEGEKETRNELAGATSTRGNQLGTPPITFQRPFSEAILGTRRRREPLLLPTVPENLPPMVTQMKQITDAAFAAYPNQPFSVDFGPTETSADFSLQGATLPRVEDPLIAGEPSQASNVELFPSIEFAHGRSANGRVTTIYRDACLGRRPIRFVSGQDQFNPASGRRVYLSKTNMSVYVRSASVAQGGGKHVDYDVDHGDGIHWDQYASGATVGGCHGTHQHYLATPVTVHDLDEDTLPRDVLAFALPDNDRNISEEGARGAWGQPVLSVMFTQRHDPKSDPFNLNVGFKFSSSGGTRFNMQKSPDTTLAPSAAIAYYHRRGHLGEPPNLLNPFWHATLVPLEIDERKTPGNNRYDPTQASQGPARRMKNLIDAPNHPRRKDAADAYDGLRYHIPGMSDPVDENGR